jgi:hypothetical protein
MVQWSLVNLAKLGSRPQRNPHQAEARRSRLLPAEASATRPLHRAESAALNRRGLVARPLLLVAPPSGPAVPHLLSPLAVRIPRHLAAAQAAVLGSAARAVGSRSQRAAPSGSAARPAAERLVVAVAVWAVPQAAEAQAVLRATQVAAQPEALRVLQAAARVAHTLS